MLWTPRGCPFSWPEFSLDRLARQCSPDRLQFPDNSFVMPLKSFVIKVATSKDVGC